MALGRHAFEIIDSWHLLSAEAKNSDLGPTTGIQELEKHAILDVDVFKCRIHLSVPTSSCFQISRDYFFPPNMQYLLALFWHDLLKDLWQNQNKIKQTKPKYMKEENH